MISCKTFTYEGATIAIIENSYSIEELLSEFSESQCLIDELSKFKTIRRKKEFLLVRVALKNLLQGEEKNIDYTSDGKPILTDGSYKISFSHCKKSAAVIIHPTLDVGIDIETPSPQFKKIRTRILGEDELNEWEKHHSTEYLRIIWSAKETLFKIIGEQAGNFSKQLRILPFIPQKSGIITGLHTESKKHFQLNYIINNDFALVYCIDTQST